jgi:hypothetical protein
LKKLFTLSIALLGGLAAQAQTLYPGNITNLVARYNFNTTATTGTIIAVPDVSGNANNSSSVTNLTTTTDFRNRPNKAMVFDGNSSYVEIPSSTLLNPNDQITMIGLVNFYGFWRYQCQGTNILDKGFDDQTPGAYYMRATDNPNDGGDCNAFDSTLQQTTAGFGSTGYFALPQTRITDSQWYFIAYSYNGNVVNIYQAVMNPKLKYEGILPIASYPVTGTMGTNSNPLLLGKHGRPGYEYLFNGAMDEVAIFNRGLTGADIYKVYSYLWGATLDVANNELLSDINTYPNPAQNELHITGKLNSSNAQLEVYNTMGQKLIVENMNTTGNNLQYTLNTSNLPTGTYIAKLNAEGGAKTIRFSIQR